MAVFVLRRLLVSFFILLISTFIMYLLVAASGDPLSDLRTDQSPAKAEKIAHRIEALHLDQPVPRRYLTWLGGVSGCVIPGKACDLGTNIRDQAVSSLLRTAMISTLRLVLAATVIAILLGITIGILSALRQYSGFDYSITFTAFLFFSLPLFWVAVLLKQYLAIGVNNWYADPRIGLGAAVVISLISGVTWGAVLGGDRRRKWMVRGIAAVATFALLLYLSATDWFKRPALGPALVAVLCFGVAVAVTALVAGLAHRNVLYSCLVMAGLSSVLQFFLTPFLQNPKWASWLNLLLLALLAAAVAVGVGWLLGGLDKPQAVRAAILTGLGCGGVIVLDIVLRTVPSYSRMVNGRILATIGAGTPNFAGSFWQRFIDTSTHLALPTLSIMLISFAGYSRYSRASMLEVMSQDYVRTARAKGLTERTVVMRHAFRNALIPVTTLAAVDFGALIGGAIITETVFGWKGMGQMFVQGLLTTDPNPVMGFFIITAISVILFNMFADIAYAYLDPRIRLS
jgi:peptide/nickel transport system permease protein